MDTLEEGLSAAVARRLLLVNLFQLAPGRWQCNLRPQDDDGPAQRFAHGSTALEALTKALKWFDENPAPKIAAKTGSVEALAAPEDPDISDIFG